MCTKVKTKILLIFIIILASIIAVHAQDPASVTLLEGNDQIIPGGRATFTYLVTNNLAQETKYTFTANPLDTYPFSQTIQRVISEPGTFTLAPGKSQEVSVTISINPDSPPRLQYLTKLYVEVATDPQKRVEVPLILNIVRPQQLVLFETNLPDELIPSQEQRFDLTYQATANILILNSTIHVVSEFFEQTFTTPIHFRTPQTRTIPFDIPASTNPGTYTLEIKAEREGSIIGTYKKTFTVGKNPDVQEKIAKENTFLTKKITLIKENAGNLNVQEEIKISLTKLQQLFTITSPAPTHIDNNVYVWEFELKPGEQGVVTVFIDYRSLAIGIGLIILFAIILIYLYNKKIFITKTVYKVTSEKDGISAIKVRLSIINKTHNIDHVTLVESIPRLMSANGEFGTLKPRSIQKTPMGHKLIWEFGHLKKGEERLITYTLHSKMHLVGTIRLPPAHINYIKRNRHITYKSNSVIFNTKKPKERKN